MRKWKLLLEYTKQIISINNKYYLKSQNTANSDHKLSFHLSEFVSFNWKNLLYLQ